jgi:hypothetical protein
MTKKVAGCGRRRALGLMASVILVLPLLLTACGGSGATKNSISATSTVVASSFPTAWCQVKLGDLASVATALLGPSHGNKIISDPGTQTVIKAVPNDWAFHEWDFGTDFYLATYVNNKVEALQAYSGGVGSVGVAGLPCAAFRTSNN